MLSDGIITANDEKLSCCSSYHAIRKDIIQDTTQGKRKAGPAGGDQAEDPHQESDSEEILFER